MKQENQFDKNRQQTPVDKSKTVNAPLGGKQPSERPTGGAGIDHQRKPTGGTTGTTERPWDKNK